MSCTMLRQVTDQMGNTLEVKENPCRIISLVPSQTELLYDLGLREEIVGITKFCIHPDELFRTCERVGGTKNLDFEKIKKLQPELIIGNKEENEREQVLRLMQEYPVWMSDIKNLEDALQMILAVGTLLGKEEGAFLLADQIKNGFDRLQSRVPEDKQQARLAYLIWKKPYMAVSRNTFIHDMLQRCGFRNVFAASDSRYPQVSAEEIQAADPEIILLSSEPYPFQDKHVAEFRAICPHAHIEVVDGELFSWYGSRLRKSPDYFLQIINSRGKGSDKKR